MTIRYPLHSDQTINEMFYILRRYIDAQTLLENVYASTVLKVDTTSGTPGGIRGRIDRPFDTINHALARAESGDIILLGPGTYAENVVIPSTLTSLSIIGAGKYLSVINAAAGIGLRWTGAAGTVMTTLIVEDCAVVAAGNAIQVDGTATPTCFSNGLLLRNVFAYSTTGSLGLSLTMINNVQMYSVTCGDGSGTTLSLVGSMEATDCRFRDVRLDYQDVLPAAGVSGGPQQKYFYGCQMANLNVRGSAGQDVVERVICDTQCYATDNITVDVMDGAADHTNTQGSFEFHGYCAGNMVLTHNLTDGARTPFNCDRCELVGTLDAAGTGTAIGTSTFRNAVLQTSAAGGITTGQRNSLNLLGATFNHTAGVLDAAGVPAGTCNRDIWRFAVPALTVVPGDNVVDFTTAPYSTVDFTDANYSVVVEIQLAADAPIGVHTKLATGFTFNIGAGGGANIVTVSVIHD